MFAYEYCQYVVERLMDIYIVINQSKELERRQEYLSKAEQLLGKSHLFLTIITKCLQNESHNRPTSSNILEELRMYIGMYGYA